MTTFDLGQIQEFVASLDARMGPGMNGASENRATLGATLRDHGALCHEFTEKVREWGRTVFSGRIEFDPEVESVVRAEGALLSARAEDLRKLAVEAEAAGEGLEARGEFQATVDRMNQLLNHWVRPQLAVGPGPRHWQHVPPEWFEEARRQVAALPPLPADWPFSEEQRRELNLP